MVEKEDKMKNTIIKNIQDLDKISARKRIESRIEKYSEMGVVAN